MDTFFLFYESESHSNMVLVTNPNEPMVLAVIKKAHIDKQKSQVTPLLQKQMHLQFLI